MTAALPAPRTSLTPGFLQGLTRLAKRLTWGSRISFVMILLLLLMAILAPFIVSGDPTAGDTADRLQPIGSPGHLLGTDGQGRDNLLRLVYGARPSLMSGIVPVVVSATVGTFLGLVAGLGGRRVNTVVMRTLDVFYAFPAVLLSIAIAAALGPGISNAIIALAVVLIPPIARVAEAEAARLRQADFMVAAESSGASKLSVAVRQALPNVAPPIVVYCTALVGLSIIYAGGLGFLGLGIAPPNPEWGVMVNDARQYVFTDPSLAIVPAVTIVLAASAFNVLGDGLRNLVDIKSEGI